MTEDAIHTAIVRYLRSVLPHGWDVLHIPGNGRSARDGARLQRMGLMKGAPDIMILGNVDVEVEAFSSTGERVSIRYEMPWTGFVEVKAPKGRLSSEQRKVHDRLTDKGYPVAVLRSIDDARDFISAHNLPSREARS